MLQLKGIVKEYPTGDSKVVALRGERPGRFLDGRGSKSGGEGKKAEENGETASSSGY